jgi:hypothetical protein
MLTVSYFSPGGVEHRGDPIPPTGIGEDSYAINPCWPTELVALVRRMGKAFGPDGLPHVAVPAWARPKLVVKAVVTVPNAAVAAVGAQVTMFDLPVVEKKQKPRKTSGRKRTPDKPQGVA